MELEVKVTGAALDDVVASVYDHMDEEVPVTLGDVVVRELLDRLTRDPRWDQIAQRFWDSVDEYLRETAPEHARRLVEQEVARQLADTRQGAVTRGKPSTRAEAIVATEVTGQLRAQFARVVERALADLGTQLADERLAALAAFRKGAGHG